MNQILHQETPFGWLAFEVQQNVLRRVRWIDTPDYVNVSPVLTTYVKSLLEGQSMECPWVIVMHGTEFQQAVWRALTMIRFGETRTYADIAKQVGSPRSFQAVGQACRRNPLPLIIPCHRVVSTSNGVGGYCGIANSDRKMRLLENEKKSIDFYRTC